MFEPTIDNYENTATKIVVSWKKLTQLPPLCRFTKLLQLSVCFNDLTELPELPASLIFLDCFNNKITSLPSLPKTLKYLMCNNNLLTSLPPLPENLEKLYCEGNRLTQLPILPNNLCYLNCARNELVRLPLLPNALKELYCSNNTITVLPELLPNLLVLDCEHTLITRLSWLPDTLDDFYYNAYLEKIYDLETFIDAHEANIISCITVINTTISTINAFREMWFTSKFRNRFLQWMEPVIQRKYHPANLEKLLFDAGNDEEKIDILLENW